MEKNDHAFFKMLVRVSIDYLGLCQKWNKNWIKFFDLLLLIRKRRNHNI